MPTKAIEIGDLERNAFRVFLTLLEAINEVLQERDKKAECNPP